MDDEDEVRDLNLSSRPLREERRRLRERGRLERGMARSHHPAEHHSQNEASNASAAWTAAQRQMSPTSRNSKKAKAAIEERTSIRNDMENRRAAPLPVGIAKRKKAGKYSFLWTWTHSG